MQSEKESNVMPGSQNPADNYPTDSLQSQENVRDSSRYSHPDARPRQDGPGGENGQE